MRRERHIEVPVLIAGAGPAGLMAAIALAREGVESLLVERRRDRSTHPRATGISTRSMELLRSWGLEEAVRAGGVDAEWMLWTCETMALASAGSGVMVGYPTREQSAVVSPSGPACVPQDHLEPVLRRHLASLGPARVRIGTEVVSVEARPDGVQAVLSDVATGELQTVRARYLVGADGAHSTVRRALGIQMQGSDDLEHAVTALFRAPLWDLVGHHRYGIYNVTHPEGTGSFLPAGRDDRWGYGKLLRSGGDLAREQVEETLVRRIQAGAGSRKLLPRIERIGTFTFAAQLAETFRRGSAFLIGDAAHRVTPRGGTGMNTAIHDGYDLGWKLAWVLRGWAGPGLLDTYEAERRPVAEHNAARSADENGSRREVADELHMDLGGRIAHAWLPSAKRRTSTLDLLGSGLTLLTGPSDHGWEAVAAEVDRRLPVAVRRLDEVAARAIGIRNGGAVLARPDGLPLGYFSVADRAAPAMRGAIRALDHSSLCTRLASRYSRRASGESTSPRVGCQGTRS